MMIDLQTTLCQEPNATKHLLEFILIFCNFLSFTMEKFVSGGTNMQSQLYDSISIERIFLKRSFKEPLN